MRKMDFSHIYNQLTPDAYLSCLKMLDYREPDFVHDSLRNIVTTGIEKYGKYKIIDLACGYGFNGAIAKYGVPYTECNSCTPKTNNLFCHVVGIDISVNAVKYAHYMNFIDDYILQNLETEDISEYNVKKIQNSNLIVSSGSFSYISEKTLNRIYSSLDNRVDFLGWPIYGSNISDIVNFLNEKYCSVVVDEQLFPMRSFFDEKEQRSYINQLKKSQMTKLHEPDKIFVHKIYAKAKDSKYR